METRRSDESGAREVLDALGEGITIHDADGMAVEANRAADEILHLDRDELTSRNYRSPACKITDLEGRGVRDEQIVVARPGADPVVLSVNAVTLAEGTPSEWAGREPRPGSSCSSSQRVWNDDLAFRLGSHGGDRRALPAGSVAPTLTAGSPGAAKEPSVRA